MVQIAATERNLGPRSIRKKREILEAAARVFRRRGLQAAGMRDIAAEAGMQAGNLYYYFASKQDLLAFCQRDGLDGLLDLARWVESLELAADQKLYLLILGHVRRVNEETPGSLAHLEIESLEPAWRDEILPQRDLYQRSIEDLIRQGADSGVFRNTDAKTAALAILGSVNWTVKWYRPGGSRSAISIGRSFAELLVRGLLASEVPFSVPAIEPPLVDNEPEGPSAEGEEAS